MNKAKLIVFSRMVIIFILISNTLLYMPIFAQDNDIKKKYKMLEFYCYKLYNEDTAYKFNDKYDDIMNYSVEIMKKAPESSQAAATTLTYLLPLSQINYDAQKIYENYYNKFMNNFENTDINLETAEKLFFLMTHLGHIAFSNKETEEIGEKKWKICKNVLKKIKNECKNNSYRALATLILASVENKVDYLFEFIEKYPNHPIISTVKLSIITAKYDFRTEKRKYIDEIIKLMSEYKDVIDASGYTFEINCYEALAGAYLNINDKITAQKYIDIIKTKTPDNPILGIYKSMMNYKTWDEVKEIMKKK